MSYSVDCIRDEHGESFVISSIENGELKGLSRRLTEGECRTQLSINGLSMRQVQSAIRLARETADLKQRGGKLAGLE